MCFSPEMSAALALLAAVLAVRLYHKRDKVCFLWALFAFYAGMELLQTLQHRTVNQCDTTENQVLAAVAFLYVIVQPLLWNYYAFKCRSPTPFQRGVFTVAMLLCAVMVVGFLQRWNTGTDSRGTDMLTGQLCTTKDEGEHLRWSWPLGVAGSTKSNWYMYFVLWFVPLLFAQGGPWISGGLAFGAAITYLMVNNKQTFPATWCFVSIPLLFAGYMAEYTS